LKERANTVAVDLPGHGRSRGSAKQRVEDYAADLVDFIKAIAAPNPIPCGLSMGGAIAQQLLLDHAGFFRAGIIVSSGARLRVLPSLFEMLAHDFPAYLEMVDRLGFSENTASAVKQPFMDEHLKARPEVAHGDFKACDRFDVIARLASIRVPVLVISAADDKLTPPKYAEFLVQHIPGSRGVHIPDAGHFVPIEKPQAVNAAIAAFLDEQGLA
jgi:pimeloyl-ACP methyl ester carboxylesterase